MATKFKACSLPECNGNAHWTTGAAKGYCNAHYLKFKKYGDPLARSGKAPDGDPLRFIEETALPLLGGECLYWPFAKNPKGYGRLLVDGVLEQAHRYVCQRAHGAPPSEAHQAAHSCGKGHLGCISPHHLSWKTPKANSADMVEHGNSLRGERNVNAKLSAQQVHDIVSLKGKMTQAEIGERYGIRQQSVSKIHKGATWGWLA